MSRTENGTFPLWACVTRVTVSPTAPVRLVRYINSWITEGKSPR